MMSLRPLVPPSNDGLRELQPGEPAEFLRPIGSTLYNVTPSQESTMREYLRVLLKRKWMMTAVVLGIFMAVAIASLRQTPIYEAATQIVINKADSNLITFTDSGPVVDYYDPSDLDTEVRILQSDLMALQVIRQLNIDKRPEFGGHADQKQPNLVADPLQTAGLLNPLATTYVEQNFETKCASAMQASDWISKQLVDLQMKVETS